MKFTIARVGVLVWALVYGGLLSFALGVALRDSDGRLGHGLSIAGLALVLAGVCLVWVRSRMVARHSVAERLAGQDSSHTP